MHRHKDRGAYSNFDKKNAIYQNNLVPKKIIPSVFRSRLCCERMIH